MIPRGAERSTGGCEIKQIYLTSGDHDLVLIVETANGDNIAKLRRPAA
jgi:uncharacterized protein with GYD domain